MLVAISIPIFTAQLEKSRDATDLANVRSAYAELSAAIISNEALDDAISSLGTGWTKVSDTSITYVFNGKGQTAGFDSSISPKIGNITVGNSGENPDLLTFTLNADKEITAIALSKTT